MRQRFDSFSSARTGERGFSWGDGVVLLGVTVLIYVGIRLAVTAPQVVRGPEISLSPTVLPFYAVLSVARMSAAYALSLLFTLPYGYLAAHNRRAERVLMPLLDVLQSVPILSFLPVVLLSFSAILPERLAAELASIVLIFTSQVWNLTFAWYQSLTTIPKELREASTTFQFGGWMRLNTLALPFAAISLIWNSMMSWAGGWFFLMAAEIFTVGQRDFRLLGLGSYLKEAANQNDLSAVLWGIVTLVVVIIALDQLVWRPLLAWSDRFRIEMIESEHPPTSWFYDALRSSRLAALTSSVVFRPATTVLDTVLIRRFPASSPAQVDNPRRSWALYILVGLMGLGLLYGAYWAAAMLLTLDFAQWLAIAAGVGATMLRVLAALVIALLWTIPVGVAIGTNPRLANLLQPIVQITASVPATALFPVFLLLLLGLPGGLNMAAVLLMLMGTQWYLLFNIIAGASAIPQDLKYTAALLQLTRWEQWRTLILPALFPYLVTGAITASGGAWNASIVAEYVEFGGRTLSTPGVGALIAEGTAKGEYPLLLASTLSLILTVVAINRLLWRRLYRLAEEQYRME
ncbi:MAG: ABC transporter permease subunit [Anaerolineae bacterium]|nr:ABC transporter permease subunit [Anaerolineae bacterium]